MQRWSMWGALGVLLLCSTGCGFHLRSNSVIPVAYQQLQLQLGQSTAAERLRQPLVDALLSQGINLDDQQSLALRIIDVRPTRQLLNGRLTEVLLALSVDFAVVDTRSNSMLTPPRTLTAKRSYQYDIATVNTDNQQQTLLEQELYQDIAAQLVRQLGTGRLPQLAPQTAP